MPCPTPGGLLILGLGNDILTDDAVGLHVVRRVLRVLHGNPQIRIQETCEMGLSLLDYFVDAGNAILVDSIQTGAAMPGTLHELEADQLPHQTGRTPHFLGVGETLALGRLLGLPMPHRVRILAVEVEDPFTLGTSLTPVVDSALDRAVERVLEWAAQLTLGPR